MCEQGSEITRAICERGKGNTILTATHVFLPLVMSCPSARTESSKSAATSIHLIISSTIRLCGGSTSFFNFLDLITLSSIKHDMVAIRKAAYPTASSSSTSTEYANSAPLFVARSCFSNGNVLWAVSPPTNCRVPAMASSEIRVSDETICCPHLIEKCDSDDGFCYLLDSRDASQEGEKLRREVN